MTAYYNTDCGYGLSQELTIGGLTFYLNPEDLVYSEESAGTSISIKYDRMTRQMDAVVPTFNITLRDLTAAEVEQITQFAITDFTNKVLTTGLGSLSLYYKGENLTNLYIQPPIQKGTSWFDSTQVPPVEIFDSVELTLINPGARWY